MKKISILLLLMALAFVPLAMNGQGSLVIGNGTSICAGGSSSFTGGSVMGNTYNYYTATQSLYLASELDGAKKITSVAFYHNSSDSFTTTLSIYLAHTTNTTLSSSNAITSGTANYSASVALGGTTAGWQEFTLTTPFEYDGTSNLVVVVTRDARTYKTAQGWQYTTYSGSNRHIHRSSDSSGVQTLSNTTSYTASTNRPNIKIGYELTTPYVTLDPSSATVITGFTQTLTATTGNVTGTPTITYSSSNTSVATVSGSGTTATVTAVAPGTATITATMAYGGTNYTATCAVTVEDPSYCKPSFSQTSDYIKSFTTDGGEHNISNTNTSQGTGGYTDYYNSHYVSAEPGTTISFSVVRGYSDTYQYGLWVDWNKDYVFDNSTEKMASTSSAEDWSSSFTIPANTAAGDYHMRVLQLYGSSTTLAPCASASYGEGEDYKLTVLSTGAYTITCATTTHGTISADKNNADENDVITVTATPETNYVLTALTYTPEGGTAQNINIASTPYTFTMPAANVTVNATFTLPGNLPPYALTVGTPLGHSVVLGWTGVSTNTNHQNYEVYYSTTNTAPSDNLSSGYESTNTVPYTLEGLAPTTTYYAWVRDNCGTDGKSAWVAFGSFTTDVACPAPNTLTDNNLTAHSAHVSWNGEADSYTVLYHTARVTGTTQTAVFEDGFENGLGNWTTYANDYADPSTTDWMQYNASNFTGITNHGGSYVAMSMSYNGNDDVSVDNWLVSPQMTLGDAVKFWVLTNSKWPDAYAVYVSTGSGIVPSIGGTNTGDFIQVRNYVNATGTWEEISVNISEYAGQTGYVAIRHTTVGGNYLLVDDFGVYTTVNTYEYGTDQYDYPTTNSCQLTGLTPETLYEVMVQGDCGTDGTSNWSSPMYFTTPDNCGAPQELAASNVTATTATLTWADDKDSYNLKYRKVYFYEGFESGSIPSGWTVVDANNDGLTWGVGYTSVHSGSYGAYNYSYVYQQTGISPDDYLISPQLDLQGTLRMWLCGFGDDAAEYYSILVSTTGNSVSDFTTTLLQGTTTAEYAEVQYDLSSYAGQQGYIAIRHHNCTDQRHLYVDDFGLYGNEGTDGWVTLNPNPTTESVELTGLTPGIGYEWQVQGLNCNNDGDATDWSAVATFNTIHQYTKTIAAYNGDSGWYLVASPLAQTVSPATVGMITDNLGNTATTSTSTYDLYSFNQAQDSEWQNYRASAFNLVNGTGYLYASKAGTTLTFTGDPYSGNGQVTLHKTTAATGLDFPDWNLVGNPFAKTAYINKAFYTMKSTGDDFESNVAGTEIPMMEGIFVVADSDNESLTFTTTAPTKSGNLTMNVTKDRAAIDRAIVNFGQGQQLPKFQLNPNHTKVYMPIEGKDYAVVSVEENGEMPVNFKAEKNGTYTLSFTTEEVSFGYLHLIDNMTGNDVDLLATPSYSFNAKTTDYESRFKLVFATGNNANDDNFAFYSNGSFVINNEGEATLQVIDVNGRILKSESINGCANVNVKAAAGVYMLRLVNGNDVKVQKVVVR